jgi:hypothetical protein
MDWIDLAQDRDRWQVLVDVVMNPQLPYSVGSFLTGCGTVEFSIRTQLHGVSQFCVLPTDELLVGPGWMDSQYEKIDVTGRTF